MMKIVATKAPLIWLLLSLLLAVSGDHDIVKDHANLILQTAPKGLEKRSLQCFDPDKEEIIEDANGKYCIYGISYSGKMWGDIEFRMVKEQYGVIFSKIEVVAAPLCSKISARSVKYGGGRLHQIGKWFFACCTNCSEFWLPKEQLRLKFLNLCIAQMRFNRIYKVAQMRVKEHGRTHYYFREFYRLSRRMEKVMGLAEPFASCFSENFIMKPSMLNNFLCLAYGAVYVPSDVFDGSSLDGSETNSAHSIKTRKKHKIGYYAGAASESEESMPFPCNNFVPPRNGKNPGKGSHCMASLRLDVKVLRCCCYGHLAVLCQKKLHRIAVQRDDVDPMAIERKACFSGFTRTTAKGSISMINLGKNLEKKMENLVQRHSKFSGKPTVDSLMSEYLGDQEQIGSHTGKNIPRKYCSQNISFSGSDISIEGDTFFAKLKADGKNTSDCLLNFIPDYRREEIQRKRCFITLPDQSICPADVHLKEKMLKSFVLRSQFYCCCNHMPFCNHQADAFGRLVYSTPVRCLFNNEYQHVMNVHLRHRGSRANHTCIMHYANANIIKDMLPTGQNYSDGDDPRELLIIPGTNVFPIDYGYQLMGDNDCAYIESAINFRHLDMQNCMNFPVLETKFLPLRLLVCECFTSQPFNMWAAIRSQGRTFCDAKFDKGRVLRKMKELDGLNLCAKINTISLRDVFEKRNVRSTINELSSVCYVSAGIQMGESTIVAGAATRKIVNSAGIHLDHIGYAMLSLSGDADAHCKSTESKTFCFCRMYGNTKVARVHSLCNARAEFVQAAIKQAVQTKIFDSSKKLVFYSPDKQYDFSELTSVQSNMTGAEDCVRDTSLCVIKNSHRNLNVTCYCTDSLRRSKRNDYYPAMYNKWQRREVVRDGCAMINGEAICSFRYSSKEDNFSEVVKSLAGQKRHGHRAASNASARNHLILVTLFANFLCHLEVFIIRPKHY